MRKVQTSEAQRPVLMTMQRAGIADMWTILEPSGLGLKKIEIFFPMATSTMQILHLYHSSPHNQDTKKHYENHAIHPTTVRKQMIYFAL